MRHVVLALASLVALAPLGAHAEPRAAETDDALRPLLARLAHHAQAFEEMKRRGSFTMDGTLEELDGKGRVDGTKEMVVKVTATPERRLTEIVRYLEDGADKTNEARIKMAKAKASSPDSKRKELHFPFLASEQARYAFAIAERDPAAPDRVRVTFTPRAPDETSFRGSAWVDEPSGQMLTVGFSPSRNPTFVDHVNVTLRFDHVTPLGRAPSALTFEARGGFLLLRKHYRGRATISDAHLGY